MTQSSRPSVLSSTAYAHTNIALIKYWGKRGPKGLNLPAVGSLSLTLDKFGTETRIDLLDHGTTDTISDMNGVALSTDSDFDKAIAFVQRLRALGGRREAFAIRTRNDVPTAAGLASSASGFAALTMAANAAFGLGLDDKQLSIWSRMGSGSAARSIFGGFVLMHRGDNDSGDDSFAEPLTTTLDVRLVVVRCAEGKKAVSSTKGMDLSMTTSPMWNAWTSTHAADIDEASAALVLGDIEKLGDVMEYNTLKMHATTSTARPGYWYENPVTVAVKNAVRGLRQAGTGAWFTMDAGPHVKVLCTPKDASAIAQTLAAVPGTHGVDVCAPGPRAHLVNNR